jgi:AcrR family transcriptional regulator
MSVANNPNPNKRAAILESTLKLLSERGLHDTPMSLIVKESGVSTGNVYHYFASKDELIIELYREIKLQALHALLIDDDENASHEERFITLWKSMVRYYIDHPQEVKFLEQFEHSPYNDGSHPFDTVDEIQSMIQFFQNGIDEGVLKNLPIEILIEMGMATAVVLSKLHIRGAFQLNDDVIAVAAEASWDMLKK